MVNARKEKTLEIQHTVLHTQGRRIGTGAAKMLGCILPPRANPRRLTPVSSGASLQGKGKRRCTNAGMIVDCSMFTSITRHWLPATRADGGRDGHNLGGRAAALAWPPPTAGLYSIRREGWRVGGVNGRRTTQQQNNETSFTNNRSNSPLRLRGL